MYQRISSSRCRLKENKNRKKNYCRTMSHIHIIFRGVFFLLYFLAKSKNKGWQIWFISKMERLTAYIVKQTTKNNIKHIKFIFITNVINKIKSFKTSYICKRWYVCQFFLSFHNKNMSSSWLFNNFFLYSFWVDGFMGLVYVFFAFVSLVIGRQNITCH